MIFTKKLTLFSLFGKISPIWIWNNIFFWKILFVEVIGERIISALRIQYMATWLYVKKYENMTSSKRISKHHHIRRFVCKCLLLKVHHNARQTPGTTNEEEKKYVAESEGTPFWLWFWNFFLGLKNSHNGGWT